MYIYYIFLISIYITSSSGPLASRKGRNEAPCSGQELERERERAREREREADAEATGKDAGKETGKEKETAEATCSQSEPLALALPHSVASQSVPSQSEALEASEGEAANFEAQLLVLLLGPAPPASEDGAAEAGKALKDQAKAGATEGGAHVRSPEKQQRKAAAAASALQADAAPLSADSSARTPQGSSSRPASALQVEGLSDAGMYVPSFRKRKPRRDLDMSACDPVGYYNGNKGDSNLCFMNAALQLLLHAMRCLPDDLNRCSRLLTYAHVCSRLLTSAHVCSCMLTSAHVCSAHVFSRMLMSASVSICMLTYADVCRRMLLHVMRCLPDDLNRCILVILVIVSISKTLVYYTLAY